MYKLPTLKAGDRVEIIAPASRCADHLIADICDLLTSWQLTCTVSNDIFGDDLLCANSDSNRFHFLKDALLNPNSKAIICARGGYGSMRLIPELTQIAPVATPKLFIGMSDITALNIFLQQNWQWPTLHGALALDKFSPESIAATKSILFGDVKQVTFKAKPLNALAEKSKTISAIVTGGNLCVMQAGIGTAWQLNGRDKIILLEDIGERGYRVDRMLEHLTQANMFKHAKAIVFGDFIEGNEPDGSSLVEPVLARFANACDIPVMQIAGVGHGYTNLSMPLGTPAQIQLGKKAQLICEI